ncbi:hypothetical protein CRYUN_Cryun01aG0104100 [Craigia yunnanensis]
MATDKEVKQTGTEANADASGLEINVWIPLPPNPVPSNVSGFIKVDCADNMLLSLSKDDTKFFASTGVIVSCQDVGLPINGNSQGSQADQLKGTQAVADASELEKINVGVLLPPNSVPLNVSAIEKVDGADNMLLSLTKGDTTSSASNGVVAVNTVDKKLSDLTFDELDHIVLKERRKLLLKRKLLELEQPALEGTSMGLAEDLMDYSAGRIKEELQPIDGECMTTRNQFNDIPIRSASDPCNCSANGSSSLEYCAGSNKEELQFVDGESWLVGNEFNDISNRSASDLQRTSDPGTEAARSGNRMEESNIICPSERTSMEFKSRDGDYSVKGTLGNMVSVKCEEDISDGIDHMLQRDWMKLLTSVEDFDLNSSWNFECLRKTEPAAFGFSPIVPESTKPISVNRPRKRKKTAMDSVLTALEEDAPGILKVLLDQGVSVDESKLYGESENDDALDASFNEDSFSELEAVMTKPGICSFVADQLNGVGAKIFNHLYLFLNDITGNPGAQGTSICILPLVLVGEDLTEGERKVLMEYGWIPNTGLGTMLNYCDRIVHDRKNESDTSEWRSKIGKLLVDGYNGVTIVSTRLAENVIEHQDGENTQVKLEF